MKTLDVFKLVFQDFRSNVIGISLAVWPLILLALAAEFSRHYLAPIVYSSVALALKGVVVLFALKHLFNKQSIAIDISFLNIFVFWFAAAYVSTVTTLGYYLFFVPGVLLSCLAVFFPIFIAKNNQGPIEALASSVDVVKTNIKQILVLYIGIVFSLFLIKQGLSYGALVLVESHNLLIFIFGLFKYLTEIFYISFLFSLYLHYAGALEEYS